MKALVIHGPNLNLVHLRDPSVYGSSSLADIDERLTNEAHTLDLELSIHQSAREGEIIELLHVGIGEVEGALLNPGAYAHTSRAIADAIEAVGYPVVEVHLSNIHAREEWRRVSVTAERCRGLVSGFGADSYVLGLRALANVVRS
ncbi:MAG: 3-dehydroquinate dehydratase [Actinomycetota bacterium]|nr:3-dehydroquinate dehydratase [Actinomycetota bacterium]